MAFAILLNSYKNAYIVLIWERSMSKLSLKKLSKIYEDGKESVNAIDLDVRENEFLVLVGPSGCGKSTTLRMIAGLEEVTAGEILIDDVVINDMEAKNRDIAMVFQNYALYPHMTVYDNMAFSLKLKKLAKSEIDKMVKTVAENLEITDILNKKPAKISGGQKQRVALGRAIIRNPKVFLMDEPLSNLDAKLRLNMRMEIIKLHKRLKTTFIYVTHDQVEAMTMGDRIAVMNDGEIMQIDTPEGVYQHPANLFVAEFIGAPKINVLKAECIGDCLCTEIEDTTFCVALDKLQLTKPLEIGAKLLLAFRPEDVVLVDRGEDIASNVDVIENLGSEKYLFLENDIALKVPSSIHIIDNALIKIKIRRNRIHVFDAVTGDRI